MNGVLLTVGLAGALLFLSQTRTKASKRGPGLYQIQVKVSPAPADELSRNLIVSGVMTAFPLGSVQGAGFASSDVLEITYRGNYPEGVWQELASEKGKVLWRLPAPFGGEPLELVVRSPVRRIGD